MVNNYYQKYKEKLRKKVRERYQNLSEENKKVAERLKTNIKIFVKKKKKRTDSIINLNVTRIFLKNKSKGNLSI